VKAWAAGRDEATLYLSILTIAEYDKGIANLPDADPRQTIYMTTRDSLAARFAAQLLPASDAIVRRWGSISGTGRRDTGPPSSVIDTVLVAIALEHDLIMPPGTSAMCATVAPPSSTPGRMTLRRFGSLQGGGGGRPGPDTQSVRSGGRFGVCRTSLRHGAYPGPDANRCSARR
jgi:predicted nucleic acid-binding protein